jgi:hypothetical protein
MPLSTPAQGGHSSRFLAEKDDLFWIALGRLSIGLRRCPQFSSCRHYYLCRWNWISGGTLGDALLVPWEVLQGKPKVRGLARGEANGELV